MILRASKERRAPQIKRLLPRGFWLYFKVYTSRGIIVSLCAVIVIGVIISVLQRESISKLKQLTNSQQAVANNTSLFNDIQSATVDAETGQRGYLLTGNPLYLAPYNAALPKITSDFKQLRTLHQNAQDMAAINKLQTTVNQKLAELRSTLAAANTGGLSAAVAIVDTNQGLNLMNSIRSQVGTLETRQGNDVSQERSRVLARINTYQEIQVLVRICILLFGFAGMYLIGKTLYERFELERSKGEFIDIAAHQLRTPASVVKLHLGALLNGYVGALPDKQLHVVQKAYDSNEHAIKIIEDVLQVAKVDNGDTVIHRQSENLQQLLNEAIESMQPTLKKRKQKIVREFPKRPIHAELDAVHIRMVIENLLDNASKYSPEKTPITVGLKPGRNKYCIYVADKGVGIAKRDMAKLFKKFSRVENELSDSITGSGLGLYWAQQIAELHGGKISVKSKLKAGSTFTLELPVKLPL